MTSERPAASQGPRPRPHLAYIDCARGYAVLMVIACHAAYEFPQLPYPAKRLATSGWFGVQLFFLVSCLTLLMSWHAELRRAGRADMRAFFVRRLFRIAPAYYAAGVLYFFVQPPPGGFDAGQALAFATFTNAFAPQWAPTVAGAWNVVPGGWSVGVEFSFYALFPLFAGIATSLPRALGVFVASLAAGAAANLAAASALSGGLQPNELSNFLFFWLPNQACVFALGGVLFFVVRDHTTFGPRSAAWLAAGSVAAFAAAAWLPLGQYLGDWPPVPAGLAVCAPLTAFVAALSRSPPLFVNRAVASFGKVSFSAYLTHFAVLRGLAALPGVFRTGAAGYAAIVAYAAGLAVAAAAVWAVSALAHEAIEKPGIAAGRSLIAWMRRPRGVQPA